MMKRLVVVAIAGFVGAGQLAHAQSDSDQDRIENLEAQVEQLWTISGAGVCGQQGMVEFQVLRGGVETIAESAIDAGTLTVTVCNKRSEAFPVRRGTMRDTAAAWTGTAPTLEANTCASFQGFMAVIADARNIGPNPGYIQGCYRIE